LRLGGKKLIKGENSRHKSNFPQSRKADAFQGLNLYELFIKFLPDLYNFFRNLLFEGINIFPARNLQ
jgi:hypothetical protein